MPKLPKCTKCLNFSALSDLDPTGLGNDAWGEN